MVASNGRAYNARTLLPTPLCTNRTIQGSHFSNLGQDRVYLTGNPPTHTYTLYYYGNVQLEDGYARAVCTLFGVLHLVQRNSSHKQGRKREEAFRIRYVCAQVQNKVLYQLSTTHEVESPTRIQPPPKEH